MVFCTKTTFLYSRNRHHPIHVSSQVRHWSIRYKYLIHQLFRRMKSLKPRPYHEIYHTRFASCKTIISKLNSLYPKLCKLVLKLMPGIDRLCYVPYPKLLWWKRRSSMHDKIVTELFVVSIKFWQMWLTKCTDYIIKHAGIHVKLMFKFIIR